MLSPLYIEDHQKKNSRECSDQWLAEDTQNRAGSGLSDLSLLAVGANKNLH
jgi:hypothetical protein